MDAADEVWNRALDFDFEPSRPGDRALADVLQTHSLIMNGGLAHALEVDHEQAERAVEGFKLLGAPELPDVMREACAADAETDAGAEALDQLDDRYAELVPGDERLEEIFRAYFEADPEAFEPL